MRHETKKLSVILLMHMGSPRITSTLDAGLCTNYYSNAYLFYSKKF